MSRLHIRGFTLIELMITVVIVGILTMIALPSYQQYIIRANRRAAQVEMMDIANREQQFLLADRVYADKAKLEASGYNLPRDLGGRYSYDISIGTGAVPSFNITFTAIGSQSGDGDLALNSEGVKLPADKW